MILSDSAEHNVGQMELCMAGALHWTRGLSRTRTPQQHSTGFQCWSSAGVTMAPQYHSDCARQSSCRLRCRDLLRLLTLVLMTEGGLRKLPISAAVPWEMTEQSAPYLTNCTSRQQHSAH